jgi:hypothetical protein
MCRDANSSIERIPEDAAQWRTARTVGPELDLPFLEIFVQIFVGDPGLHDGIRELFVDVKDTIHPLQDEGYRACPGRRVAPAPITAGAVWPDRHPKPIRCADDRYDLFGGSRVEVGNGGDASRNRITGSSFEFRGAADDMVLAEDLNDFGEKLLMIGFHRHP